jgi:hypothetical protein
VELPLSGRELSNSLAISGGDAIDDIAAALRCGELLPRHGDADRFLRRDEMIDAFRILGDG